jgi:hypothetical protein
VGSIEEIAAGLKLFYKPEDVRELRALGVLDSNGSGRRYTFSGYFDSKHVPEMAAAAANYSGRAEGVYFTLNPVNPALLARAPNKFIPSVMKDRATPDRDIVRREYFLIDADPVRPSGVSSTDEEHELALERVRACAQWLGEQGWPEPVIADSGNGGHAIYHISLPNDEAAKQLLKGVLELLDRRFSDEEIKIDTTTYNAARISKVYGTKACKGFDTDSRPHRISGVNTWVWVQ